MRAIHVGVDFDGVVTNFTEMFIVCAYNTFPNMPLDIDPEHVMAWNFEEWYPITKEQVSEVWKTFSNKHRVWEALRPIDYEGFQFMVDTMRFLQTHTDIRFFINFITHRHQGGGESIVTQSRRWVHSNLPLKDISCDVTQAEDKATVVKNYGVEFFIDDLPKTCGLVKDKNPDCHVYLRNRAWNSDPFSEERKEITSKGVEAVWDLKEFTYAMCANIRSEA